MKNKKRIPIVLILVLCITILAGCKPKETIIIEESKVEGPVIVKEETPIEDEYGIITTDGTVSFVDGTGERVTINKKPKSAVVLFASFVDIWVKNGGDLVGMVEASDEYSILGTENVKTVGKQGSISLEEVIALQPDLVVLSANTKSHLELIPSLEENKIQVIVLDYKYKADYFKIAKVFAAINDKMELFDQEAKIIREKTQDIIDRAPKENNPKVLIMFATKKSISARTSESTVGEIFKDLNVINIADSSNDVLNDKNFSLEKIIEEDPDFIFVQSMGSDIEAIQERIKLDAESNPAWASLSAVKNNKYIALPKELYTYKANDRYAEAYEEVAKILYPEIFK